jgi:hypothetical protein
MPQNFEPYTHDELTQMGEMPEVECRMILKQILFKLDAASWSGRKPTTLEEFRGDWPFQGWGMTEDWTWYFRRKNDHATLRVGPGNGQYMVDGNVRLFAHEFDSPDGAIDTFVRLWLQLEPRVDGNLYPE